MVVFSWNVNKNRVLLDHGLRHVAAQPSAIGAFQEVPGELTDSRLIRLGLRKSLHVLGTLKTRWRSLALVATTDIASSGPPRSDADKVLAVSVTHPAVGTFDMVTVHAISQVRMQLPRDRLGYARELRRGLDSAWPSGEVVVAGDFNVEPFQEEIWHEDYLFALRDLRLVHHLWTSGARPLYNPGWSLLAEEKGGVMGGTFRYDARHYSHWIPVDYVLLSPVLGDRLHQPVAALDNVNGVPLLDVGPVHTTIGTGDHLPIVAMLT